MNLERLLQAETDFLVRHPLGFNDPELIEIGKKHKMDKMIAFTQEVFSPEAFKDQAEILQNWIKTVSRSSMVSVFEKPKFKDMVNSLSPKDQKRLVDGLYEQLHGDEEAGFNQILDVLIPQKLAKWSLMTIAPAYFDPTHSVFVKPTTAKGVVAEFELEGLQYKPRPSWAFYSVYRDAINEMKTKVDENLSPSNAAFSGFLMMTMN